MRQDLPEAQSELDKALKREEMYWKELSGDRWLKEGDKIQLIFPLKSKLDGIMVQ